MDLKQIHCFIAVAEELSFTAAAERLYLSQPSLSRHIQNLEEELGIPLFIRDRKTVEISPSGLQLLSTARAIAGSSQDFLSTARDLSQGRQGKLRLGYQSSARFLLPQILRRFSQFYPNVDIALEEYGAQQLMQMLCAGELDLCVAFSVVGEGLGSSAQLLHQTLFVDQMELFLGEEKHCLSRAHPQAPRLQDFSQESSVQISREVNPAYFELLHSIFVSHRFHPARTRETPRLQTLMLLVQSGLGISLLPKQATLAYYPHSYCLQLEDIQIPLPIEAIWRSQNSNPCLSLLRDLLPQAEQ